MYLTRFNPLKNTCFLSVYFKTDAIESVDNACFLENP